LTKNENVFSPFIGSTLTSPCSNGANVS
jgi:hypothetical protein